jgi:hypothetical protein
VYAHTSSWHEFSASVSDLSVIARGLAETEIVGGVDVEIVMAREANDKTWTLQGKDWSGGLSMVQERRGKDFWRHPRAHEPC